MKCSFEAVRDLNTEINRFGFVLCYYEILGIELVAQRFKTIGLFSLYNKMKKKPACTSTGFKTIWISVSTKSVKSQTDVVFCDLINVK